MLPSFSDCLREGGEKPSQRWQLLTLRCAQLWPLPTFFFLMNVAGLGKGPEGIGEADKDIFGLGEYLITVQSVQLTDIPIQVRIPSPTQKEPFSRDV